MIGFFPRAVVGGASAAIAVVLLLLLLILSCATAVITPDAPKPTPSGWVVEEPIQTIPDGGPPPSGPHRRMPPSPPVSF